MTLQRVRDGAIASGASEGEQVWLSGPLLVPLPSAVLARIACKLLRCRAHSTRGFGSGDVAIVFNLRPLWPPPTGRFGSVDEPAYVSFASCQYNGTEGPHSTPCFCSACVDDDAFLNEVTRWMALSMALSRRRNFSVSARVTHVSRRSSLCPLASWWHPFPRPSELTSRASLCTGIQWAG